MRRPPPRSARTDTLFPYTTLSRYHRWFRTVLVPQVRHLGIVTIDAQGILPEKKLVDSRCLRAPPASQQRVRSPEIQLAVGKLLRELRRQGRSEEHTSELQSLMRISYAVFCLKQTKTTHASPDTT